MDALPKKEDQTWAVHLTTTVSTFQSLDYAVSAQIKQGIFEKLNWILENNIVGGFRKIEQSDDPTRCTTTYREVWIFDSGPDATMFRLKWS